MPLLYSPNRDNLPSYWTMYFGLAEMFLKIILFGFALAISFLILRKNIDEKRILVRERAVKFET
jgi:amino acid permease